MTLFRILGLFVGSLFALYSFFIAKRFIKFIAIQAKGIKKVVVHVIFPLIVFLCCINPSSIRFIIAVQFIIWSGFADILHLLWKLYNHFAQKSSPSVLHFIYRTSIFPFVTVLSLTLFGIFNISNVDHVEYNLSSPALKNNYRFHFLSDLHFGTIQDKKVVKEVFDKVNQDSADFIILGGDLCDEGTSKTDMEELFALCGSLKSRYGTFFIYGNHDRQLYSNNRTYTIEEFENALTLNSIKILQDESVLINDELLLAGREDYSARYFYKTNRKTIEELTGGIQYNYLVVADHQPKKKDGLELAGKSLSGGILQVSGHTHAGQVFPFGQLMKLGGGYVYGIYEENGQDGKANVIVSSGVTGWGYAMRTEQNCEWVTVDLKLRTKK